MWVAVGSARYVAWVVLFGMLVGVGACSRSRRVEYDRTLMEQDPVLAIELQHGEPGLLESTSRGGTGPPFYEPQSEEVRRTWTDSSIDEYVELIREVAPLTIDGLTNISCRPGDVLAVGQKHVGEDIVNVGVAFYEREDNKIYLGLNLVIAGTGSNPDEERNAAMLPRNRIDGECSPEVLEALGIESD